MQKMALATTLSICTLAGRAETQLAAETSSSHWAARAYSHSTSGYGYSDCTTENSLGLTNGGEIAWFQGFDTQDRGLSSETITEIASANGWAGSTNGAPAGSTGAVYVYDDPLGDHTNPTDLTGADLADSASWSTCCPNTDTKEPVSLSGGAVSDGFWLAAMLPQAAGEFPAPMDTDTAPSNSRSWIAGSNTSFDPMAPGAGIGFFEMAALGFDSHWVMSGSGTGSSVTTYCTAKSGLACGTPSIGFSGTPQACASSGFVIDAQPARGQRTGLILYSCTGRANFPFQGGLLCVNPPLMRTPITSSGGTSGQCDGRFALDWNAFASGNGGGNPAPHLKNPGQQVNTQWWGRDTVATGSFLSDALEFFM